MAVLRLYVLLALARVVAVWTWPFLTAEDTMLFSCGILGATLRLALSQLQSNAPPMSIELSIASIERELGRPIDELFVEFDPDPIAALRDVYTNGATA